ncbi:MAG: hypothetical protein H7242_03680, partial [Microbacteriaceae bacterium]|nr:hypothetical protein [Burkholderiaceae bacterium]
MAVAPVLPVNPRAAIGPRATRSVADGVTDGVTGGVVGGVAAKSTALRPGRRSHAERREEAERRLLAAALELVARRGSVRMTLAAHRFGSKAGLVHALAGYIGERFGEQREEGPK